MNGLIYKLIDYKCSVPLIKYIHAYLQNRHFQVLVENTKSSKRRINAGIPQGSVFEPKLFNIYLNDIPTLPFTKTALFADETAIYCHSFSAIVAAKRIQMHITYLEQYYKTWKVSY